MARLVRILLILALVSGCSFSTPTRFASDYFPIGVGMNWKFQADSLEKYIYVDNEEDSIFHMVIDGIPYDMKREFDGIYNLRDEIITYGGDRIDFGVVKELYLPLPFVSGDSLKDTLRFKEFFSGDTIDLYLSISITVRYAGTLSLPYGDVRDTYHVRRKFIRNEDTTLVDEWYAPNLGLVKRKEGKEIWVLTEFSSP